MADIDTDIDTDPFSNTMNTDASVSARSADPSSSCPCCVILPDDLFLPRTIPSPSSNSTNLNSNSNTAPTSSSRNSNTKNNPSNATTTISSSSNNNTGESVSGTDPERSDLTPQQVYQELVEKSNPRMRIQIVDTHCHAHLERPSEQPPPPDDEHEPPSFYHCNVETDATSTRSANSLQFVSLTCAVEPSDWSAALEYAAQSPYRVAAIGIHPWYLAGAEYDPDHPDHDTSTSHPSPTNPPQYLQNLEQILRDHPHAAVGEIGLCKMARWTRQHHAGKHTALSIQRRVCAQQLRLAAKYQRPATIHCVDQQKILLEVLKEQQAADNTSTSTSNGHGHGHGHGHNEDGATNTHNSLPPAMALHSFSGTAHQVEQLLKWEASLNLPSKKAFPSAPIISSSTSSPSAISTSQPLLYFGFSHAVNCAMSTSEKSRRQGRAAIRAVPPDRLLAESDLHRDADVLGGTVAAVAYLAWALDESVEAVAERTARNGLRFLHCLLDQD